MIGALLSAPSILSIDETVEVLQVSRLSVCRWILTGKLRAFNPDEQLLILRSDLQEFLEKGLLNSEKEHRQPNSRKQCTDKANDLPESTF